MIFAIPVIPFAKILLKSTVFVKNKYVAYVVFAIIGKFFIIILS